MSQTKKAAVIGHPIAHSKSPLIHGYWIKKHGLDATYKAIDIAPENLARDIVRLADEGYAGFNVTVPHKENVFRLCDSWDETAKAVGAVNTVVIDKKGGLKGFNTDVFGFIENIRANRPGFNFTAGPAVVLGAGGAARAVIHGLLQEKTPEIRVINRTKEKAQMLARDFKNLRVHDWDRHPEILGDANLVVNTTSLGMKDQPEMTINLERLKKTALVNDTVYTPLYTGLLAQAEENGNPVVTGIGMLLHQARPAFAAWFGIMPEVDEELQRLVLQ